jgi:hypothetical protein
MCDMVILGCKSNVIEPGNSISTLMSSALDLLPLIFLTSKSKGYIFLPWVVYMCDMVSLGSKDNVLEPGKHYVYIQTDGRTDNLIPVYPPHNFVAGGILTTTNPHQSEHLAFVRRLGRRTAQWFTSIWYVIRRSSRSAPCNDIATTNI